MYIWFSYEEVMSAAACSKSFLGMNIVYIHFKDRLEYQKFKKDLEQANWDQVCFLY